ncbi:hypothetical protein CA51_26860 [Rosistilla oblonga]|nr:hypothetical protein CA51_26860 [Rosistilla oblonga]
MRDCNHLDVTPPQQLTPNLWSEPVAMCCLKTDAPTRIQMASDATKLLGTVCPPNTDCHYHRFDLCENCPSYQT